MNGCELCETDSVPVIEVSYLTSYFLNLTEMYSPVSSDNTIMALVDPVDAGEFLHNLIQEDWEVFSERLVDRDRQEDLLAAILNARYTDAEWMRQAKEESPFDSSELYTSRQNPADYRLVDEWNEHKQEVLVSSGGAREFPIGREDFRNAQFLTTMSSVINLSLIAESRRP